MLAQPPQPAPDKATNRIFDRLLEFSRSFPKKDFLNAFGLYYRTEAKDQIVLSEEAMEDSGRFIEWYIHDYLLPSGKTIIESYYEKQFSALSSDNQEILESLMQAYISVYEVQEVTPGMGMRLKDIMTGAELEAKEVSGSYQIAKWDILIVRAYTVKGISRFTGNGTIRPRERKKDFLAFLQRELDRFSAETGKKEWPAFMKTKAYLIEHFFQDSPAKEPDLLTKEGHDAVLAQARFDLMNSDKAISLLDEETDFFFEEELEEKTRYTWIKRGKSKDWEEISEGKEGIRLDSKMVHPSGKLEWDVLGTITLGKGELTLECLSRERLARGKKRIKEILGRQIKHREDSFEDVKKAVEKSKGSRERPAQKEPLSPHAARMLEESMRTYMLSWLNTKLPALDGMTPREAASDVSAKGKLIEILKDFENMEEKKRRAGDPYIDVAFLKKELGL